jgi:ornithine carbamoyltransferase
MKNLLSIESLTEREITDIVELGASLRKNRGATPQVLNGQCWALIFNKSSTRTRVSFEVGIRELGGDVMFLSGAETQLGRGEPVKDTARVLGRMVHGAVIRTYAQSEVEEFARFSKLPTINALTDAEHPCQILADLQLIREQLGGWRGKKVCFLGDGDCNVARSWMWAAARLGFDLSIGAPQSFQPDATFMAKLNAPNVTLSSDPKTAVNGADVVYTDVWVSMGKEEESVNRFQVLQPYQINAGLMVHAAANAVVMHCLPAYRDKEITDDILEKHADVIFQQAENRLHAQKAVITWMLRK